MSSSNEVRYPGEAGINSTYLSWIINFVNYYKISEIFYVFVHYAKFLFLYKAHYDFNIILIFFLAKTKSYGSVLFERVADGNPQTYNNFLLV